MGLLNIDYDAGDVPMSKVKMKAKHEYEYIANFKVLQTIFKTKKIDKVRGKASFGAIRVRYYTLFA
jgi:hypothetical protein